MTYSFDHLVVVASDVEKSVSFYADVLGADVRELDEWRLGLVPYPVLDFGRWRINVHPVDGPNLDPRALSPRPGSVDLCVSVSESSAHILASLKLRGIPIEHGPIEQQGARGPGESVYFRDPDGNLLEIICYPVALDRK
jgi:catechol 2,3-dioxygenase-like lactoylglutathione lyase family enzyme